MTDKSPWLRHVAKHEPHIVGEFDNIYGEHFIIYRNKNGDTPYITGDELDWTPKVPLLWNNANFTFSAYEREQIARILWPTMEDLFSMGKAIVEAEDAEAGK